MPGGILGDADCQAAVICGRERLNVEKHLDLYDYTISFNAP
jgi:hypothetical protein